MPTRTVRFKFEGNLVDAYEGRTIAAALLAAGIRGLGHNPTDGTPRGMFCAMGVCQECVVLVNDARVEACRVVVREGMVVRRLP